MTYFDSIRLLNKKSEKQNLGTSIVFDSFRCCVFNMLWLTIRRVIVWSKRIVIDNKLHQFSWIAWHSCTDSDTNEYNEWRTLTQSLWACTLDLWDTRAHALGAQIPWVLRAHGPRVLQPQGPQALRVLGPLTLGSWRPEHIVPWTQEL